MDGALCDQPTLSLFKRITRQDEGKGEGRALGATWVASAVGRTNGGHGVVIIVAFFINRLGYTVTRGTIALSVCGIVIIEIAIIKIVARAIAITIARGIVGASRDHSVDGNGPQRRVRGRGDMVA